MAAGWNVCYTHGCCNCIAIMDALSDCYKGVTASELQVDANISTIALGEMHS